MKKKILNGVRNFPMNVPVTLIRVDDGWKAGTMFASERGKVYEAYTYNKSPEIAIDALYREVMGRLNRESPIQLVH